jgi:triosephosphate isomerase
MSKSKKLIIANWKMNPQTLADAKKLFMGIKDIASRQKKADISIIPPIAFLSEVVRLYTGSKITFGAQNVFWERKGSFTGEVSARQAKEAGASYVIAGHSERRALGETDYQVSRKMDAILREGMRPILCVGEIERDSQGRYLKALHQQIEASLEGISKNRVSNVIIAYEPVWAIGKDANDAIDSHELHAAMILVKKSLAKIYDKKTAMKVRVIYGGSVESTNAKELWTSGIDGFLVGHASLDVKDFIKIIQSI